MARTPGWLFIIICIVAGLSACSKGSSTDTNHNPNPIDPAAPIAPGPSFSGQAMVGPLVNATVNLFTLDKLDQPFATTRTSESNDLSVAGTFSLPQADIVSDQIYLLTVTDGADLDANLDGAADAPTTNSGTLHALVPGRMMLNNTQFNVSLVTEVLYQRLRLLLASGERDTVTLLNEAAYRAQQLLTQDLSRDNLIDIDDVLLWHSVRNKDSLRANAEQQQLVADRLRSGDNIAPFAFEWMSPITARDEASVASDIALTDNLLINADLQRGMVIYDLTTPDSFNELSATLLPHNDVMGNSAYWGISEITATGSTVFATASYSTLAGESFFALLAIDISNPTQPTLIGTLSLPDGTSVADLRASNGVLYAIATNAPGNIAVFDTSTLSAMTRVADINTNSPQIIDLLLVDNTLYVTTGEALLRYDTLNALTPSLIDNITGAFGTLAIRDDLMLNVSMISSIELYRLSGITTPTLLSRIDPPAALTTLDYYNGRPVFAGDSFFIGAAETNANVDGDIQRIDITDPTVPRLLGTLIANTTPTKAYYLNDRLYVMAPMGKLRILATGFSTTTQRLNTINVGRTSDGLLAGEQRLYQYDVSSIDSLAASDVLQTTAVITRFDPANLSEIRAIALQDNVAFIAGSRNLLDIAQFDNLSGNGTLVGSLTPPDTMNITEVLVADNSAWVIAARRGDGVYKLFDIDISNRSNLLLRSEARLDDSLLDTRRISYATRAGSALYIQRGSIISIVDANNPAVPSTRGTLDTTGFPVAHTLLGTTLIVVTTLGDPELHSDDIAIEMFETSATPLTPVALSRTVLANHEGFGSGIWKNGAALRDKVLYIAMGALGTYAIDVKNPAQATLLGQLDSIGPANSVVVTSDNVVTVLDSTGQLNVFAGVSAANRP